MSFNIIYNLTDVKSASGNPTAIDTTATVTLETMYGYKLPDTVTVTGATGSWDKSTGTLSLSDPTADVTITAAGVQIHYITLDNLKKFKTELFSRIPVGTMYGAHDTAYGSDSVAGYSGRNYQAVAIGRSAQATADGSIAVGTSAQSLSLYATAIGRSAQATGAYSFAAGGCYPAASGKYSIAVGCYASASKESSIAIGLYASATAEYSVVVGGYASASGARSAAIGAYSSTRIDNVVSFYGYGKDADQSKTLLIKSPSEIFFANEAATNTTNHYTSLTSFASGCTLKDLLDAKQDSLVSGTNIKTINGYSVLGSGNLDVSKMVSLYSGSCGYSVTLNTNYNVHDDFDILIVFCQYNSADSQQSHTVIDTAWCDNMNNSYNFNIHENVVKLQYNPQTHVLWNANNNCMIYKVLGIKFYNN